MGKIKDILVNKLDMPSEILLYEPKFTVFGKRRVVVEQHNGIISFTQNKIKIKTPKGNVLISGENLIIKNYGNDDVVVDGEIFNVGYEDKGNDI